MRWAESLVELIQEDYGAEAWDASGADPLAGLRDDYGALVRRAADLQKAFDGLAGRAEVARHTAVADRVTAEEEARELRTDVERSVSGAGTVSRQLAQYRIELAQLQSRRKVVEERDQRLRVLRARRDERLKDLDAVRSGRHAERATLAAQLTAALAPEVRVTVERYGQYSEYTKALTDALRGSGMRYNDLVASLVQAVSPGELVHFIDDDDFVGLAEIASIPKDRAARLLGHIRDVGASDIVTAIVEDNVRMSLLDGVDYKDLEHLSAGQRCTVVLSIVLQHGSRTLVIDQPEDHLDNAYIATTIVKAIRSRGAGRQLIISTHNANIPVLAGAALVVEMTSDGRNGYVQVCEPLDDPKSVEAIANVMEGGRKAFTDRAAFYDEHEI